MTDGRIPVDLIDDNPYQTRFNIDQEKFESLKDSIKANGLLSAILVRPHPTIPGRFQLVNGKRRLIAVKALNWSDIPAIVRNMIDAEVAQATLAENLQREDLNPIDEAQGYKLMMDKFGDTELEVATLAGKSRAYVANRLRLLQMDPYLVASVLAKTLAPWQALMIQAAPMSEKYRLADVVVDHNLTFDELRSAINTIRSHGEAIRFKRSVPVKGLVIDPRFNGVDTSLIEEYLSKGTQLYLISVWVHGVVRFGDLMVVAARSLGVDTLDAEVVFETAWFNKEASTTAEVSDIASYAHEGIFTPRSSTEKTKSRILRGLLKGREERYPILVIESPLYTDDMGDVAEGVPISGDSPGVHVIARSIRLHRSSDVDYLSPFKLPN